MEASPVPETVDSGVQFSLVGRGKAVLYTALQDSVAHSQVPRRRVSVLECGA